MAMRDGLTKVQLLIVLAAVLMLWFGCSSSDKSIVKTDGPTDEPDPGPVTGSLEEAVETIEGVSVTVRGLVLDQITKTPLIDLRVQLTDEAGNVLETSTTPSGVFEFKGVAANQQLTISIDSDEYEKQEFTVDPIPVDETVKLEVELIPLKPEQLPEGDGLTVGLKAPEFSLPDGDGKIKALADYAGKKKVVLIFYRGSW